MKPLHENPVSSRREFLRTSACLLPALCAPGIISCRRPFLPNILLILTDDAGYADFGVHGSPDIKTPNIDFIASTGIRFSSGYVTAPVCSPSQAGLLTGRYQQRFGHECTIGNDSIAPDPDLVGLPIGEWTLADLLKKEGYATGCIGKWHLGDKSHFHPLNRGFDEFFGFLGESAPYLPGETRDIEHGLEAVPDSSLPYLTDAFGEEACAFLEKHRHHPFLLFLSFNAPHTPLQASPELFDALPATFETEERTVYAAMMKSMDDNIGKVLGKLNFLEMDRRTLVIFLNDNGGALPFNASCNDPLAGAKGTFLEGGIRVPFFVRWPGMIPGGRVVTFPVSALDIVPTVVAAAGGMLPQDRPYDGVNLVPFLRGELPGAPHEALYWRMDHHGAIRKQDWKLIWFRDRVPRLHFLGQDIGEMDDLNSSYPAKVKELLNEYHAWQVWMEDPLWRDPQPQRSHDYRLYDQAYVETLKRR